MIDFQQDIWTNFGNDVIPYMPTHTISSGMMVWIVVIMLAFIGAVIYDKDKQKGPTMVIVLCNNSTAEFNDMKNAVLYASRLNKMGLETVIQPKVMSKAELIKHWSEKKGY